jgi:hypothetical protein
VPVADVPVTGQVSEARRYSLVWEQGHVLVAVGPLRVAVEVVVRHAGRLLVIREQDAPLPPPGTCDIRSDGLWLSLVDEGDGRFTLGLEAFALAVEHPDDARGDLVPLGLDVEVDDGRLGGDLLVDDEVIVLALPAAWSVVSGTAPPEGQ